jgi:hypothetical protein
VPAYFTPEQCDATERAGKLAGTDILDSLHAIIQAYMCDSLRLREQTLP